MTIDATKPEDTVLNSALPAYIRETRAEVNAVGVVGTGNVGEGTVALAAQTSMTIGVELSLEGLETVIISSVGLSTLTTILGGTQGQIKIFIFQDLLVRLTDSNAKANGTFHLNQAPALSDYTPAVDDVITLVNVGGDGAGTHGYWREVDRAANV